MILNLLAHGYDFARLIAAYPDLTEQDIDAALEYARARLDREEPRPFPTTS